MLKEEDNSKKAKQLVLQLIPESIAYIQNLF